MRWLLLLLFIVACTPISTVEEIEMLKAACGQCDQVSVAEFPLDGSLYATEDAICIQEENRLSCGTCACPLTAGPLAEGPATVSCTFSPEDGTLAVVCVTQQGPA